jgi:flavin-binding protein dodecin
MSEAVYKSVEITGTSTVNITNAVENAIAKASETLRHIAWFELVTVRGSIDDGKIEQFQVTVKIGFRLE